MNCVYCGGPMLTSGYAHAAGCPLALGVPLTAEASSMPMPAPANPWTLRDLFAAFALAGYAAQFSHAASYPHESAKAAYRMADAMLTARQPGGEG